MSNYLTLRRVDFVRLSDGSSMFDYVLTVLNIGEIFHPDIHEISIEMNERSQFKVFDENGERRTIVYGVAGKVTKLDILNKKRGEK